MEGSEPSSPTWPRSGMTRSGSAFELPTSARPTAASGCSSLLKTPTAQLAVNGGSQHPDKRRAGGHGPTLADEVEHLLPTPAVNDMGAAYTPQEWDEWTARMRDRHGNGNGHGRSLAIEAQRLLPTPTSMDSHASGGSTPSNVTLTDAVVRTSLGAHTNPRFADGSTSSGDQPQPPPSPDETDDPDCLPLSWNG